MDAGLDEILHIALDYGTTWVKWMAGWSAWAREEAERLRVGIEEEELWLPNLKIT